MQFLPINNESNQIFNTVLNGAELKFNFWYQDIGAAWYVSVFYPDETPILEAARINSESPIFATTLTEFGGDIVPFPLAAEGVEIGRNAWGVTHDLLYLTDAEIEAILEG